MDLPVIIIINPYDSSSVHIGRSFDYGPDPGHQSSPTPKAKTERLQKRIKAATAKNGKRWLVNDWSWWLTNELISG